MRKIRICHGDTTCSATLLLLPTGTTGLLPVTVMATVVTSIMVEVVVRLVEYMQIFHLPFHLVEQIDSIPNSCIYMFFLLAAAHPDETQLHSSQLTYDLYNPSVGIYHPGAGNIHNLT